MSYKNDLVFRKKKRFKERTEVELGRRCTVKQMDQKRSKANEYFVATGKFKEEYEDFYVFEHAKSKCREAFLKVDLMTGDKVVNYI